MKVLVVDVGNSSIKAAEFHQDTLIQSRRFIDKAALHKWVQSMNDVDHMVIGSVGRIADISSVSEDRFPVHQALTSWNHDLRVKYKSLETLGIDRLAGVVSAWDQFNSASLVFDLGSCLTIDFVDKDGVYHGGNISPGWGMRLKAMHQFTAKLPEAAKSVPNDQMGLTTEEALQNGAFRGLVFELKGYINEIKQRNQELNVILTGGDAFQFAKYLKMEIFVLPDLILRGLYKLLHENI